MCLTAPDDKERFSNQTAVGIRERCPVSARTNILIRTEQEEEEEEDNGASVAPKTARRSSLAVWEEGVGSQGGGVVGGVPAQMQMRHISCQLSHWHESGRGVEGGGRFIQTGLYSLF